MPRSAGRGGWAWRKARAHVIANATVCWLCGQRLHPEVRWPDPQSTSVDHITPLAQGGEPTAVANLAAAHLGCNMARGDDRGHRRELPTTRRW